MTAPDDERKGAKGENDTGGMSPMARAWIEASPYLHIGWMFVFSIGAFTAAGWWLDKKLGTRWIIIIGAVFGMMVGFANLYKVVLKLGERKERNRNDA